MMPVLFDWKEASSSPVWKGVKRGALEHGVPLVSTLGPLFFILFIIIFFIHIYIFFSDLTACQSQVDLYTDDNTAYAHHHGCPQFFKALVS